MTESFRDRLLQRQAPSDAHEQEPESAPAGAIFQLTRIRSIEDTGLTPGFVNDLVLKALYLQGQATPAHLMEILKLPFYGVLEDALRDLSGQELCFITRGESMNPITYVYSITSGGQTRAREITTRSAYVGPAPVTLEDYYRSVTAQTVETVRVHEAGLQQAFSGMVFDPALLDQLGPAVNSSRALFLFGPPGKGEDRHRRDPGAAPGWRNLHTLRDGSSRGDRAGLRLCAPSSGVGERRIAPRRSALGPG